RAGLETGQLIAILAGLIRYIEIAATVHRHARRRALSIGVDVERDVWRHIADATRRIHSDAIVAIQRIDVATGIQCNSEGVIESGAVSTDRGYRWTGRKTASGINADTALLIGATQVVRNIDVAGSIQRNAGSVTESGETAGDR